MCAKIVMCLMFQAKLMFLVPQFINVKLKLTLSLFELRRITKNVLKIFKVC